VAYTRLSRPNQTWALAYQAAFDDPLDPKVDELNDRRMVHLFSCALTEDNTTLTLGDSDTDNTVTFCSRGNESTPTFQNPTAQLQGLLEKNSGGSGSTPDYTSLYNKLVAFIGRPDIPYYLISRTGPDLSQDVDFTTDHVIKMVQFNTDNPVLVTDQSAPAQISSTLLYAGGAIAWNIHPSA